TSGWRTRGVESGLGRAAVESCATSGMAGSSSANGMTNRLRAEGRMNRAPWLSVRDTIEQGRAWAVTSYGWGERPDWSRIRARYRADRAAQPAGTRHPAPTGRRTSGTGDGAVHPRWRMRAAAARSPSAQELPHVSLARAHALPRARRPAGPRDRGRWRRGAGGIRPPGHAAGRAQSPHGPDGRLRLPRLRPGPDRAGDEHQRVSFPGPDGGRGLRPEHPLSVQGG